MRCSSTTPMMPERPVRSEAARGSGPVYPSSLAAVVTRARVAGETIAEARRRFGAEVIVVETAYPFTNEGVDEMPNLLGPDTLIDQYPATPAGQLAYLVDLTQLVVDHGGVGVVYWEPAWVSTGCKTRWGTGSSWENAAWFDLKDHEALPAFEFLGREYRPR